MKDFEVISRLDSRDAFIAHLKEELGSKANSSDMRADSGEFAGFVRSFEHIYAQTWDVLYPQYKGRNLVPLDTSVAAGAESYTWRQFDRAGEAMIVKDYAKDFPSVELSGKEFRNNIVSLGVSYAYSMMEIRNSAMMNLPIEAKKALYARQVMEQKVDSMIAWGDAASKINGIANATNLIDSGTSTGYSGTAGANWVTSLASNTVSAVLADVNAMAGQIFQQSLGLFGAAKELSLLCPTSVMQALQAAQAITPTGIFLDISVADYILRTSPQIKEIVHWPALDKNAPGASTTHDTVLLAKLDPMVMSAVIPQDFEQLPPEVHGMRFSVACHMRHGGVMLHYPFGATKYSLAAG